MGVFFYYKHLISELKRNKKILSIQEFEVANQKHIKNLGLALNFIQRVMKDCNLNQTD